MVCTGVFMVMVAGELPKHLEFVSISCGWRSQGYCTLCTHDGTQVVAVELQGYSY